jgi:plastocyanin
MRWIAYISVALVAAAVMAAIAAFAMIRNDGLAADRTPGAIETAVARRLVVLSIPASARRAVNPNAANPEAWRKGVERFSEDCSVCHGINGHGKTAFGSAMYPPAPDLASAAVQAMSDGALFSTIRNGVSWTGMPSFRRQHSNDDTWTLVSFVRHLPRAADDVRGQADAAGAAASNTIRMDGTSFEPSELTVRAGAVVSWVNTDPFPHDVVSAEGGFRSDALEPDARWQFTAARPGRFDYVCTLHPGMRGTLIVKP